MRRAFSALSGALLLCSAAFACSGNDDTNDDAGAGNSSQRDSGGDNGANGNEPAQGGSGPSGSTAPHHDDAGDGPGGSSPTAEGGAGNGNVGSVPEELVGIWQETRASAGDYTNAYGEDFSATSGFSVQLRIAENGSYRWSHYAAGVAPSCAHVSYFDRSVGVAVLEGDVLTLHPTQHEVDIDNCEVNATQKASLDPLPLKINVEDYTINYGGLRTYEMHLEGGSQPFDLKLLVRPPLAMPEQPPQPADFSLGKDPPFQEMQGLWVASDRTVIDFFNPDTGEYYFPELNGGAHQWFRFVGDAYETAVALQNTNAEGVCKVDIIYYEQGKALLDVLEDVGGQGSHFTGHMRWEATAARLIERVRECDEDDAVYQYDLPGQLSYFGWIYFTTANPPESFTLQCKFPLSEWQSTLCTSNNQSFYRR